MDEQEKLPESGIEAGTDTAPQSQEEISSGAVDASQILAPQAKLEDTLHTLKEYTPTEEESKVIPENITPETKLTVEVDPNFKGDYEGKETEEAAPEDVNKDYGSQQFLKDLFSNGNECVTAATGSFPVNDETRAMLALFSNGRLFVSEEHKYDGRVLGFEYLA